MRLRCLLPFLFVFLFLGILSGYADLRKPDYLPSESPYFSLVTEGADFAKIHFEIPDDPTLTTETSPVYIGVPAGATVEYELTGWDFTLVQRGNVVSRYIQSAKEPQDVSSEIQSWLDKTVSDKTYAFQELDLFCLSIDPHSTITAKSADGRSVHTKIDLTKLDVTIHWTGGNSGKTSQKPRADAGYASLFGSFCINKDQVPDLRRKRILPEKEKNQGFFPLVAGYHAEGPLLNPAQELVLPRKDAVRFTVRHKGVVILPARDLLRCGVDLISMDLSQVRIWHQGEELPCYIKGNGNNVLEEGEGIVFYGDESHSEYTADSIYYLTWFAAKTKPLRIPSESIAWGTGGPGVVPVKMVLNDEEILVKKRMNDFEWFFMQMDEPLKPLVLDCPDLVADGTVELRISVLNKINSACAFSVNVADCTTDYKIGVGASTVLVFDAPAAAFVGSPTVTLLQHTRIQKPSFQKTGASEKVENIPYLFIKKIEYTYPRKAVLDDTPLILDRDTVPATQNSLAITSEDSSSGVSVWVIKDKKVVSRLESPGGPEGRTMPLPSQDWDQIEIHSVDQFPEIYLAYADQPSTLHRTDQGYDYIIIAYQTMMEEAQKLAQRRTEQGFKVLLTDIQDIYDEFNFGYPDVDAIVRFLRYTQSEWKGLSPEFVVLIGDSTWDHRDREGTGCIDQIPTYAPLEDPQRYGEDDYYTQLWGGPLDYFADVIIGRISVREPHELADYLTKVFNYEDQLPVGPWKARNLFIADNTFERYAVQATETSLPAWLKPRYVDQIDYPHFTNPFFYHMFKNNPDPTTREYLNKKYCPACTEDIIKGFDDGALFVQYIGHGGNQLWSHERIFYGTNRSYSDVRRLAPTNRLPFIMNWSCLTGYLNFNIPPFNVCLAEEFLRYPDRGGIAIWAPSGGGSTEYHMVLLHLNMRNLLQKNLIRFGESTTETKIEFLMKNTTPDITKQYILFGDPAIAIGRPAEQLDLQCNRQFLTEGDNEQFSLHAKTETMKSGKALVYMMLGDKTLFKSDEISFSNGELDTSFVVTVNAVNDVPAKIGVYLWNEKENKDASGGVTLPVFAPKLELSAGEAVLDGTSAVIGFNVINTSKFTVPSVTCELQIGDHIETLLIGTVPENATVPVSWRGDVPAGETYSYASILGNSAYNIPDPDPLTIVPIELRRLPDERISPLLPKISYSSSELTEQKNVYVQIPLKNQTDETAAFETVLDGPGSATTAYKLSLNPGEERRSRYPIDLPEAGTYLYALHILDEGHNQTVTFPLTVIPRPDLVFVEDDFSIEPKDPEVGRTVYFRGTVANVGQGPASNIEIQGFDGDPKLGKTMTNFDGTHKAYIDHLEPGEQAPFEVVWDPVEYDGLGNHDVFLVIDRFKRILETNEDNNILKKPFVMHDLPDLAIDPTGDSFFKLVKNDKDPVKLWGQKLHVWARMRNIGDSDAEYARLTVNMNNEEIHTVFDRVPKGGSNETEFDVPLVSAKNSLMTIADKYDLVAEKDEKDNNASYSKRMYLKLRMPEQPIQSQRRVYDVVNETQFSAGEGEFVFYNETAKALSMQPDIAKKSILLIPEFVKDKNSFVYVSTSTKWSWNAKYNRFLSPVKAELELKTRVPAPRGIFDVFVNLHSSAYQQGLSEKIKYKTESDPNYIELEHRPLPDGSLLHKLGTYTITDDYFPLSFKSVLSASSTSVGNILYALADSKKPTVSCGYTSPLFPAEGSGIAPAQITWDAYLREGTALRFRARWVLRNGDTYKYMPWSDYADSGKNELTLSGHGDFLQYYVDFIRKTRQPVSAELHGVTVTIPCQNTQKTE